MNKIAIIYTTFLRDELMADTVSSIIKYFPIDSVLLIGDQNSTEIKYNNYSSSRVFYFALPYDCGLSYSRNYLIQKAKEMQIPYILVTADSIKFTQLYNFQPIMDFLETNPSIAKIGLKLNKRAPWEFNLDLVPKKYFRLTISNEEVKFNNQSFKKVDICKNFFLGKTEAFINVPYDNDLKLFEHEDHCWRLKEAKYQTYVTDFISAEYIKYSSIEYKAMRSRMYNTFKLLLFKKYNIVSWIQYSPEARKEIDNWKKENNCL